MSVAIEDEYQDVLQKAAVGLRLGHASLAYQSGLSLKEVRALIDGNFSETHARKLAPILGLDADKLIALAGHTGAPMKFFYPDSISVTCLFPRPATLEPV